ncbi:MAG: PD-(D/E)XK nuclease family protein [Deltaproteobacteria bacterium]|nr:MAG: PD-(D/E)XK nuclease family protein [Deltaproteobacteria bacterium]
MESLLVLPRREAVEAWHLQVLGEAESASAVSSGRVVTTLGELLQRLAASALPEWRIIGPLTETLLIGRLARAAGFGASGGGPGTWRALARTVAECRSAGVGAELVEEALGAAHRPLARLLAAYETALSERRLIDVAGLPLRLARALAEDGAPLPAKMGPALRVRVVGLARWTYGLVRLFDALAHRVAEVRVHLPDVPEHHEAYGFMAAVRRLFEGLGAAGRLELVAAEARIGREGPRAADLEALSREVFRPSPEGPGQHPSIHLFSAANALEEAREIARRVHGLVFEQGVPPEEIVVAERTLTGASRRLVHALEAAGLPVEDRRGRPLATTGPIRVLLDAHRLAWGGGTKEAVAALLSSRLVRLAAGEEDGGGGGPPSRRHLVRLIEETGLGSGRPEHYRQRLADLSGRAATSEASGRYRAALAALDGLFRALEALAEPAPLGVHLERMRGLQRHLGLDAAAAPAGLLADAPLGREILEAFGRDQAALAAFEEALADLDRAAEEAGAGDLELRPGEFAAVLGEALEQHPVAPGRLRGGAVRLLPVDALVGRRVGALFLAGLEDGRFPAPAEEDPFLDDEARRALCRAVGRPIFVVKSRGDAEGSTVPAHAQEEAMRFAEALAAPTDYLCLSWSRTDAQGRQTVASPFVLEVQRVLGGGDPARASEVRIPLSPVPPLEGAVTARELTLALSAEVFGPDETEVGAFPIPRAPESEVTEVLAGAGVDLATLVPRIVGERERFRFFLAGGPAGTDPSRYTGALADPSPLRARLLGAGAPPLSTSAVERFSRCRFQGFARSVLGLAAELPYEEQLDRIRKGSLVHRVLERVFEALDEAGDLPLTEGDEEAFAAAQARARAVCEETLDAWLCTEHAGLPVLFELTREEIRRTVDWVLERSRGWGPGRLYGVELRFGMDAGAGDGGPQGLQGLPALEVADPRRGITWRIRGKIDRVDCDDPEAPTELWVIDYKSTAQGEVDKRLRPDRLPDQDLQLPLYAAAVARAHPGAAIDAAFVSTKPDRKKNRQRPKTLSRELADRGKGRRKAPVWPEGMTVQDLIGEDGHVVAHVREVLGQVYDGYVPAWPVEEACCTNCEYRAVCRIAETGAAGEEPS